MSFQMYEGRVNNHCGQSKVYQCGGAIGESGVQDSTFVLSHPYHKIRVKNGAPGGGLAFFVFGRIALLDQRHAQVAARHFLGQAKVEQAEQRRRDVAQ